MNGRSTIRISLAAALLGSGAAHAETVSSSFAVNARIETGCAFGAGGGAGTGSDLGVLDFGPVTLPDLASALDVASSVDAGSIVLTCTQGAMVSISLDYGVNGGSSSVRYLALDGQTLGYQLYRDAARSQVWGTESDGLAMTIDDFPASTQTYTVYARLLARDSMPAAGTYTDTVTVTLSY